MPIACRSGAPVTAVLVGMICFSNFTVFPRFQGFARLT